MQKHELAELFNKDLTSLDGKIPQNLLTTFDAELLSKIENNITSEAADVYSKFQPMKQDAPDGMKNKLFSTIRNFALEQSANNKFIDALVLYRFLIVKSKLLSEDYFFIAENWENLGKHNLSEKFLDLYSKYEENKPLMFITLGNFYNLTKKDYKTAIKYYEKYLHIDKTKSVVYSITANLYGKAFGDNTLETQIQYLLKAYRLNPQDRGVLHALAFNYEKLGAKQNAKKFYLELLNNNPTDNDYYNYGAFLISCGEFVEGHKYFQARSTNIELQNKWDLSSDISDKTLLIHYEEGFGDTIMYCRFVPFMKNFAKKIVFLVQDELFELIKNSPIIAEGIEITTDLAHIEYDVSMGLLDTPYVLKTIAEKLPFTDKYLEAGTKKIRKSDDKLKVGIAYHGDNSANYPGRDLDLSKFNSLANFDHIELYSLQYGEESSNPKIISLGKNFKDFTDTARAITNMDIVVTTDNVILNLAGALGVKTIGLFNKQTNYRWFKLDGEDVGWYESVKPLQADAQDDWTPVFSKLISLLK